MNTHIDIGADQETFNPDDPCPIHFHEMTGAQLVASIDAVVSSEPPDRKWNASVQSVNPTDDDPPEAAERGQE